jgi:molybdate transport system permease protein
MLTDLAGYNAHMNAIDLGPVWLSLNLAGMTVVILILLATPLAWWLASTQSRFRAFVAAIVAVPLVLPPTVLGFYLLLLLGPGGAIGSFWLAMTDSTLTFSFAGLVIASVIYSLPFAVQPLQTAFEAVGRKPVEAAATLGLSPWQSFYRVVVPLAKQGYVSAAALSFAHTLGEFGVVLMVGGNIPGETRVISIAIFEDVETLNYFEAHVLSAGLLMFALIILIGLFATNPGNPLRGASR